MGAQHVFETMVMEMKKVESQNWISAARSVSPAHYVPTQARSATLAPRPRFGSRAGHSAQISLG